MMKGKIKNLLYNLKKRQIRGIYVKNKKQALKKVMSIIKDNVSIGTGGSQTLKEIGFIEALSKRKIRYINKPRKNLTREKVIEQRRRAVIADYYISSANAITRDGVLINVDAYGNRLAAISFGAKKVIIVVGRNKIVKDVKEGVKKICPGTAIKNAKRLNWPAPCLEAGKCLSTVCFPPKRMCNQTLIIEGSAFKDRLVIVVVDEDLGY